MVESDAIVETRVLIDGTATAGSVRSARLVKGGRNAVARDEGGAEYLLPNSPAGVAEGGSFTIEVTREAIPGKEEWKRPLAKMVDAAAAEAPAIDGSTIAFPAPTDRLGELGWWDLVDEARSGIVAFAGGELRIAVTPAMTLIDVDGALEPRALAVAGAAAAAAAIRRHGIGGSIGIDLPTVRGKAERQAIADVVDATLPQPFERTAVNGFGFLQIVRRRRHASLFEHAADRAPFEARQLLRRGAFTTGSTCLVANPAVCAVLEERNDWLEALGRQVGGDVRLRADAALPMSGGYVSQS